MRSVSLITAGFERLARKTMEILGVKNLALAIYPGAIMTDTPEELARKVETAMVDQILEGLKTRLEEAEKPAEPGPRDIIFEGSFDDVQDFFTGELWTDGLPIAPPTVERVEEFLRFTDHPADEIIGVLGPENRAATVWSVAVNGVMAGCRPEYMPVLVAVVEAIADDEFCIHEAGGTPGWEPLIVINGPIVEELDFNYGQGVMKVGRRANTSIGRFLRLYMRNIPGLRIPPGMFDKGTISYTFNVALAENEGVAEELGWDSFGMERGFRREDSVATVQSARVVTAPIYCGNTAEDCAQAIAEVFGPTCSYSVHLSLKYRNFHPLLIISPSIARVFAREGWTKNKLREYLAENCKVAPQAVDRWLWRIGHTDFTAASLLDERCGLSLDGNGLIPIFRPNEIGIVIAGDPDRNQARGYAPNSQPPVSKKIELPKR
ncbi:MAG: hypothetical protein HYX92_12425 [Chloroflexi bacterium]|nr:hypothetical protein [Chloroflexota bacterium]